MTKENQTLVEQYLKCEDLGNSVEGKMMSLLDRFGSAVTLATGNTFATQNQIDAADEYVRNCTWHPLMMRTPRDVLLLRWNKNGDYIYPGTKWCGAGNKSERTGDYGTNNETDKCCEAHDNATDYMLSRSYNANRTMWNPKYYTVTNCADDAKLFDCLLKANTSGSLEFGQAFFDALQVPCFANTYKRDCQSWWDGFAYRYPPKCKPWNKTAEKNWTLIDPPNFYYTFLRVNHNDTYEAANDIYSWKEVCKLDESLNCWNYTWLNSSIKTTK
uniref:Phospholipase A2 n=1 Tax=Ornithodoros moubata TaxID=6938 RepID=M9W8K4_ORNMO|nr:phospholipase A2 [Ornithodoros moubata]